MKKPRYFRKNAQDRYSGLIVIFVYCFCRNPTTNNEDDADTLLPTNPRISPTKYEGN